MQKREQPLAARLAHVAGKFSMSEIARRTGTPLASVSRYFRGTRVPADFCGALATQLGVNPTWLLTGEGAPWLSDIPERTSAMAGDLLELVQAMNAVEHMRLGALAGKHHLRVLRELNEALQRFEDLRKRLNDHARPVMARLLDDMEKALGRTDVDRATELHTAIEQVRRFCDDHELDYRLGRAGAAFELMRHNSYAALKHQQRLFRLVLAEGRLDSAAELEETIRLAILLAESGRESDAVNLCQAAMILSGTSGERWGSYPFLAFLTGQLMTNNLQLYKGIELMQRWLPRIPPGARASAGRHVLAFAMLYAGLIQPDEAFDVAGRSEVKALNLLYFAIFKEDTEYLRKALRYAEQLKGERKDLATMAHVTRYAAILLEDSDDARFRDLAAVCATDNRVATAQELRVFETQLLRKLGRKAAARKALHKAEALITNPGKPARTLLLTRALHHRNALELDQGDLRTRAETFFTTHKSAGYVNLQP